MTSSNINKFIFAGHSKFMLENAVFLFLYISASVFYSVLSVRYFILFKFYVGKDSGKAPSIEILNHSLNTYVTSNKHCFVFVTFLIFSLIWERPISI